MEQRNSLSVHFNYDPHRDLIIETRSVIRHIKKDSKYNEESRVQILKANSKKLRPLNFAKSLYNDIKNGGFISYNFDLTKEDMDLLMNRSINLFCFEYLDRITN